MSSSILEQTRSYHEDIERLERAAAEFLADTPKTKMESILQSHAVNQCVEKISQRSKQLDEIYRDEDGLRNEEIVGMSGTGGPNLFVTFYERLKDTKEYHRKFPNLPVQSPTSSLPAPNQISVQFSGEEGNGRFLDLHSHYDIYINLPHVAKSKSEKFDYVTYLQTFFKFGDINKITTKKEEQDYLGYLSGLCDYLKGFISRCQPLFTLDEHLAKVEQELKELTQNGSGNWTSIRAELQEAGGSQAELIAKMSEIAIEEHKKSEERELFCKDCDKKFAKKSVFDTHMNSKRHLVVVQKTAEREQAAMSKGISADRLLLEFKIFKLAELLADHITATKDNIEKKQSRTPQELLAEQYNIDDYEELEAAGKGAGDDDDKEDEDEKPVGIQNYPVGWDGKPIPYWLYKLHGLGVEYKCEICGNTSYFGRRAFERHFQEARHTFGMKCLRIPNTRHFQDITRIEDAMKLYKKIRENQEKEAWKADNEEEFEDNEGNVFSKKTYLDLQRQGLI